MRTVAPALSETDFQRLCALLRDRSGLEFGGPRRSDLERAIERAVGEMRLATAELLYERLTEGAGAQAALESFIASLTIPETYFFRNRPQFEALERSILPELIARRRDVRRLRIWSVGCASGEEPYSLAILLRRLLPDLATWDVLILATDLNRKLLEKAQRGVYSAWSFRDTPPEIQEQHFVPRGAQFELAPQVRSQVHFAYLNLADDSYPSLLNNTHDMDLVLFRNVLIYFGEEMARRVVDRLHGALADGGWLLVGHAEPSLALFNRFATRNFPGAIAYQKIVNFGTPAAAPGVTPDVSSPVPYSSSGGKADRPIGPCTARLSERPQPSSQRSTHVATPRPVTPAAFPLPGIEDDDLSTQYQAIKALADQSQLELAHRSIDALVKKAPLFAAAHYLQGLILQEAGDTEGALVALRRCVYLDAGFALGHLALVNLYSVAGHPERARTHRHNIARLLAGVPVSDPVPEGDGLTVGELLRLIGATG